MSIFRWIFSKFAFFKRNRPMLNLILFGPPGSGKGTQAEFLIKKFNILHISTGDLFRYEIGNNTELGLKAKEYMAKGELVPDSVTIGMLENKVNDNPGVNGIIFDGFPRTNVQAQALDSFLDKKGMSITALVALDVAEDELVRRLLRRGESSGRPDDVNEDIIKNRIAVYKNETAPVFDYYKKFDKAVFIDGMGTVDEIFDRICTSIDSFQS